MPDSIVSTSKLRLISKNFQKNAALSLLYCFFLFSVFWACRFVVLVVFVYICLCQGNDRFERLGTKMITYGFDYAADRFDSENPVQMATLEWSTVDEDGYYHRHSLRMEHHSGDGFKAAKRAAVAIVSKGHPDMTYKVRDCWRKGKVYASFNVDVSAD